MTTPLVPIHVRRNGFDPVEELTRLRREEPISRVELPWGDKAWLVTRYRDIRTVLGDAARFSNGGSDPSPIAGANAPERSGFLLAYDPPDHTRLRKLLTSAFTVARMRALAPRVADIISGQLDEMAAAGGPVDLVESFALPIPSLVICELLGVPYTDRAEFQTSSRARLDVTLPMEERVAASTKSREYLTGFVAEQRRSPGDGMIGMLIREHGDEIDDGELTGVGDLLLLAGHETTSNMLSLGVLLLLRRPDQYALIRDAANVDNAIEELLRYLTVVHSGIPRVTMTDVVVGDTRIPAGEMVVCALSAGNRDPELDGGRDLERIDLDKTTTSHLAFGHGIHHCLGAPLARLEMRIAYPALFDRFPGLRLANPDDEIAFRTAAAVFGVDTLPVTW